jgi:hypothetical protein
MIDIVICAMPGIETTIPILAPAVLKSSIEQAGFKAMCIDLNHEINVKLVNNPLRPEIISFFTSQNIDDNAVEHIGDIIEYCAQRILDTKAKIVGLSLLTQDCQFVTFWLCYHLKTINPEIKILIGGSGIKSFIAQSEINFASALQEQGFIDDYINGDGELAILEYLKGNLEYPGINSNTWNQISNLDDLPWADFSDYPMDQYPQRAMPICDSRGCVRSCEFCDIIEHWKKYQYRTADNVFAEMEHQIAKHGIKHFVFNNSLTNGNMKEFNKLLDMIGNYNDTNKEPISWEGYFIIRNSKQHPEDMWAKLKKTNAKLLLGVESVIERVRIQLGKNFLNVDIDWHLEMAKKYQVNLMLLLIVAYPTEFKKDFEFTKQWFKDRKHYAKTPIKQVQLSMSAILPGTELKRKQEEYGIVIGEIPTIWLTEIHDVTSADRIEYFSELSELLNSLGMSANNNDDYTVQVMRDELDLLAAKAS